jgi:hypothetical protein
MVQPLIENGEIVSKTIAGFQQISKHSEYATRSASRTRWCRTRFSHPESQAAAALHGSRIEWSVLNRLKEGIFVVHGKSIATRKPSV